MLPKAILVAHACEVLHGHCNSDAAQRYNERSCNGWHIEGHLLFKRPRVFVKGLHMRPTVTLVSHMSVTLHSHCIQVAKAQLLISLLVDVYQDLTSDAAQQCACDGRPGSGMSRLVRHS